MKINRPSTPDSIVIFGSGEVSNIISAYALLYGFNIVEYIDHDEYAASNGVTKLSEFVNSPHHNVPVFVAVGYKDMNRVRQDAISTLSSLGLSLCSIVPPSIRDYAHHLNITLEKNVFVGLNVSLQPFCHISTGSYIWDNSVVGHHSSIGSCSWLTAGSCIGGHCSIGERAFLGLNSTLTHMKKIGKEVFIGAHTLCSRDLDDQSALIKKCDQKSEFTSDFLFSTGIIK